MQQSRQVRDGFERLISLLDSKQGPIDSRRPRALGAAFLGEPRPRSFTPARPRSFRGTVVAISAFMVVAALLGLTSGSQPSGSREASAVTSVLPASDDLPIATGTGGSSTVSGDLAAQTTAGLTPALAGSFANSIPAQVADQPPLKPHEVFGFAPYWTLGQSGGFDLSGLTTVDYFSIGLNADGSLSESGPGWQGYESQNFIDLIDQAHSAGDRVVVTVNDFSQASLDQLTLSTTAPQQLAQSLLFLVKSKNLDGVNLDLEGDGSGDQAGLTNLVKVVSTTLKAVNPDYQITMDTYASSAGDPAGFYDVPALSQYVDGFFVMAYQLNLNASPGSASTLTSSMFSDATTVGQYANAVPPSKVILGLPFFGYDWPTTNGTLGAQPSSGPSVITYGEELSSGHPMYWDAVTDTAWTSYQDGQQWHEAFFENPDSLYLAAQLAQKSGLGGVGIWALGMDGSGDQAMVSALDGNAPAQKDTLAGPSATSTSSTPSGAGPPDLVAPTTAAAPTTQQQGTTTTTSVSASGPVRQADTYTGNWLGSQTALVPASVANGHRTLMGSMTDFATNDPALACLGSELTLDVYAITTDPSHDYVIARKSAGDCANAGFSFWVPSSPVTSSTTSPTIDTTTTTTATIPS